MIIPLEGGTGNEAVESLGLFKVIILSLISRFIVLILVVFPIIFKLLSIVNGPPVIFIPPVLSSLSILVLLLKLIVLTSFRSSIPIFTDDGSLVPMLYL